MRILITGGAGFIGSHIVDAYLADGHEVAVVDNLSTGSLGNVPSEALFFGADISDARTLNHIFKAFRPDVVSHHAAQISVVESMHNPSGDAGVNVGGSLNVWQCARDCGAKRFIFSSSGGAIYGQVSSPLVSEDQPANPLSPYGLSKMAFENYLTLLKQFDSPIPVILRYANVYGPRQGAQGEAGVISIFSRRLMEDKSCVIYGNGHMTRDYVFVKDVARANCAALYAGDGGVFNIGSGEQTSTVSLYMLICELLGISSKNPQYAPERQGEVARISLDCLRAAQTLGWKPTTPLCEGLGQVLDSLGHTPSLASA
ncbi:NAD-dependent epimerase/dehydratase family protein [bacterium]|nr:MAG: NAD-dependent epimerase/dehydratase family protein [bacterium]